MKEVRWTETARKSLQETSEFILEIWDKDIHEEFVDQLDYRIKQLRINPELGPPFRDSQIRKLIIHKTASLFYINTPEFIKLLVIWDNRQDPVRLLEKITDAGRD
jgi:plasmid stabilization system protein ParE